MSLQSEFLAAVEQGLKDTMADTFEFAYRRSSGTHSSAELARKDHPFATRHGSPLMDPGEINVQSGMFRSHWQQPQTTVTGDVLNSKITNDSEVADFLRFGTRKMFARPIESEAEDYAERQATERITDAIARWGA